MSSGVFPLYIGKSKEDQRLRAHLDRMIEEGGNASQWVKSVLLAAIDNDGTHRKSQDEKLDMILEMLRNGHWPQVQVVPEEEAPGSDDTGAIQDWLSAAESSFG